MIQKRFKAVCTETGREFFPEYQGLQDGPDMRVSELKKRKGKILHHWPLQVWVPAEYTNKVELCQSTGLHDANGQPENERVDELAGIQSRAEKERQKGEMLNV